MAVKTRETILEEMFDAYCKKVAKNKNCDLIRHEKCIMRHEVPLSERHVEPYMFDVYFADGTKFEPVCGITVSVCDDWIAEALSGLNANMSKIILLAYFAEMTDRQIADVLGMKRSTVQLHRTKALSQLALLLRPYYEV